MISIPDQYSSVVYERSHELVEGGAFGFGDGLVVTTCGGGEEHGRVGELEF